MSVGPVGYSATPLSFGTRERSIRDSVDTLRRDGVERQESLDILSLVAQRRDDDPLALAIEDQSRGNSRREWSYGELWSAAEWIAAKFNRLGLVAGDRLALVLPRGATLVLCELAAFRTGVVFIPLAPDQPSERLARLIADCEPKAVLVDRPRSDLPSAIETQFWIRHWQADEPSLRRHAPAEMEHVHSLDAIAYGVFTSGSTGRPKAAMNRRRGIAGLALAQAAAFGVGPGTRVLQFSSPGFDAMISEVFVTLAAGGTLCLADAAELAPGLPLAETLRRRQIEAITLPPSLLATLPRGEYPRLKTLVVAGEPCSAELASAWSVGRRFINAYGPSECTVCATMHVCPSGKQVAPSIGRAIPGVVVEVRRDDGAPAQDYELGELWISGAGVGEGYWNRPDSTAERFVREGGQVWYRTGDRVLRDSSGDHWFLGRIDDQVKVHGVRIELGEIVAAIRDCPGVSHASVVTSDDGVVQAFVSFDALATEDDGQRVARLREQCLRKLPLAFLPSRWWRVDAWPTNTSGKVDRARLFEAALEMTAAPKRCDVGPATAAESLVLDAFRAALQNDAIGVDDDFFAAGGDSLSGALAVGAIERGLGSPTPLSALIEHATARRLAAFAQTRRPQTTRSLAALRRTGAGEPLFLIHPGGGNVLCYRKLAQRLAEQPNGDRSIWALQAAGLEHDERPLETIDAMAAAYVAAIDEFQPNGPVRLAGWSFGGFVAYEMARRWRAVGREVAWLGLIDCGLSLCSRVIETMSGAKTLTAGLMTGATDCDGPVVRAAVEAGVFPSGLPEAQLRRYLDVFLANVRALAAWQPREYGGRVDVFQTQSDLPRRRWPDKEWGRWAADVVAWDVPGEHLSLLGPGSVDDLAAAMARSLVNTRG